jgi:integrase
VSHIEKRGKDRWRARYRGPDGRERSRTFDRRVDGERWLATVETAKLRGEWVDPVLGRMTFAAWVDQWERSSTSELRPRTKVLNVGVARNYLVPRFGALPLARITTDAIKAMLADELAEGRLSTSAVRRHVLVLRVILEAAVDDGRLTRNPAKAVKLPAERSRPMRFLRSDEVARLTEAAPAHYRPLILTAAYVGLRWGELAGLGVEHIDTLRRTIRVERQLVDVNGKLEFTEPKTEAGARTVSVPKSLVDLLAGHMANPATQESGLMFPSPGGRPMRSPSFRRVWQRACAAAGLKGLVFNELRHTAAALAIEQGAHPMAIKERLGHSSITVTLDRYGGLFPRLDEQLAEGLDETLRESLAASSRPESPKVASLGRSEV